MRSPPRACRQAREPPLHWAWTFLSAQLCDAVLVDSFTALRMERIRTHVFVSFANVDVDVVRRLANRLQADGVAVWTGDEKLTPGTLDWEQAVRGAIDTSFAVVFVASPDSARSVYVRGELAIANARGLPIFSVWACGESWADCAPLMLTSSQYVDCRSAEFEPGMSRLADLLHPLAEQAIPTHFLRPLALLCHLRSGAFRRKLSSIERSRRLWIT